MPEPFLQRKRDGLTPAEQAVVAKHTVLLLIVIGAMVGLAYLVGWF